MKIYMIKITDSASNEVYGHITIETDIQDGELFEDFVSESVDKWCSCHLTQDNVSDRIVWSLVA